MSSTTAARNRMMQDNTVDDVNKRKLDKKSVILTYTLSNFAK